MAFTILRGPIVLVSLVFLATFCQRAVCGKVMTSGGTMKKPLISLAGASLTVMTLAGVYAGRTYGSDHPAVKIVLVGDSTVATGGGWGPGFCAVMTPNVACVDDALNGRSSKSFIAEGAWAKALAEKGNYYLIQFGHNDMKGKGPDRETDPKSTFAENLRKYIADARAIGAKPVLVTSLSRRTYKNGAVVEDLKDYAESTRQVGLEEHVSVVDLNAISTAMLNHMTQAEADRFDAVDQEKERLAVGKSAIDRTHLNPMGQNTFGRIVAEQLALKHPELRKYVSVAVTEAK
jgi:lysophospholipase L1-like esterase